MTDEGLKAWWPDLAIIVLDLRRIGEHVAADGLVASAAKGTTSSEVLGEVGSVLEQNRELQPRLGAPARSAWKRVMADVHGAFPGRRVARWLPMPTAAGRGTAWLRALLYLPFLLAALVLVKDRLVILDYEILSGGQTGVQLLLMRAAAFLALVACGTSGFLLYFILMLHPLADLFTKMRKPALIIAGAVFGSLAAILWVDDFATNELRHVQWAIERIAANGWRVEPCSRDTGICIHWEGRMGRATVKSQAGSRDAANAAIAQWRDANRQGADLLVEWGTTPAGWVGVRSASAGNLKLSNRWRGG